jgi:hypothetical protein
MVIVRSLQFLVALILSTNHNWAWRNFYIEFTQEISVFYIDFLHWIYTRDVYFYIEFLHWIYTRDVCFTLNLITLNLHKRCLFLHWIFYIEFTQEIYVFYFEFFALNLHKRCLFFRPVG